MARVLIVAEEGHDLRATAAYLEEAGFQVQCLGEAQQVERLSAGEGPDIVVLEWTLVPLPEAPALLERCRSLHAPVVVVLEPTELNSYDFTRGGADFLVTPVNPPELVARIQQTLWRSRGVDSRSTIRLADLVIDQDRYEVSVGGRRVFLTFKEYQLLALLASNPGRVYTREALLSQVWDYDYFGGTRTVDVHVRRLRSKIEDADHTFIETVRNVGYRFHRDD